MKTNMHKSLLRVSISAALLCGILANTNAIAASNNNDLPSTQLLNDRSTQATYFIENKGQIKQTDGQPAPYVKYLLQSGNVNLYLLEEGGIAYQFNQLHYPEGYKELMADRMAKSEELEKMDSMQNDIRLETYRMDMKLIGANPNAKITTQGKSADYMQYYTHNALFVHYYKKITYHQVYPGIDWVVYITANGGLKYDFVVQPGAAPNRIKMEFTHQEELYVDRSGNLIQGNLMGKLTDHAPVSLQEGKPIATKFKLTGNVVSFELGSYNPQQEMVIDPALLWATYYGGTYSEQNSTCAVDGSGNVYLSGTTYSNSSIASGGHQNTFGGALWDSDAYLVKFNSGGVRQWATYYGGSNDDIGFSCTADGNGNVYLSGWTISSNNIASGGHQNTYAGAFLVKFTSGGVRQWATYYGGGSGSRGLSCVTDGIGNVYLVGNVSSTSSNNIASGGHQNTYGGGSNDAFLVKFNSAGVRQWATFYGGNKDEYNCTCAVDGSGNVYLSGTTESTTNIASGGHQNTSAGYPYTDAFLVKFNSGGVRQWATYLGGSNSEEGYSCAVSVNGDVYLSGKTQSLDSISFNGHQNLPSGGADAFLVKFNSGGIRQWATYYGGIGWDEGFSCTTDGIGNVYLAGTTSSTFNIALGGYQNTYGGGMWARNAFLVKFNSGGVRQWATYYGGSDYDKGYSCAADGNGNVYLAGVATSTNLASGGHQNTNAGSVQVDGGDAFLAKFQGSTGVGIEEINKTSFIVFPNPTMGQFTLQTTKSGVFELLDLMGKVIRTFTITTSSFVINEKLPAGIYFMREQDSGNAVKLVLE
ncbi:MAG: SBBP repeat-containing protein [Bacteroidetes bacterium]|nr:SBBP repeat-containing protein [Bacteroidota bacterium]